MKHKIAIIVSYIGRLPGYFSFFAASCKRNPSIDFFILNDTIPGNTKDGNITYWKMSLAEFNTVASERLGFAVNLKEGWKMNELKPALGFIFEDRLKGYDFWGWSDLDIIFGAMRSFLTEETLNMYDVFTTREKWTTGHFTLFRNDEKSRALFLQSPSYRQIFTSDRYTAFEESSHRWQGEFFTFEELLAAGKLVSMYDVVRNLEKQGLIRAHFRDIIREHPQPVNYLYRDGRIFDLDTKEEFFYHHLITIKKIWRFYIPRWKEIPGEFLITRWGIMRTGESKVPARWLWFAKRAWNAMPAIYRSVKKQRPSAVFGKLAGEVGLKANT